MKEEGSKIKKKKENKKQVEEGKQKTDRWQMREIK